MRKSLLLLGLSLYAATLSAQSAVVPNIAPAKSVSAKAGESPRASRYDGSKAAQDVVKSGDDALKTGKVGEAIADYKKAISIDPDFAAAHKKYVMARMQEPFLTSVKQQGEMSAKDLVKAMDKAKVRQKEAAVRQELLHEYTSLMAQHPDRAVYPWALSQMYVESGFQRKEQLCRKALHVDKNFPEAYTCLASIAAVRGNDAQALAYQRKAMELEPGNAEIAGVYASFLLQGGKKNDAELQALLGRFPNSDSIASDLVRRADELEPRGARIAALEKLYRDAQASGKREAASLAAEDLYPIYLDSGLTKAQSLTHDMARSSSEAGEWSARAKYVDALIKARDQVGAGHADAALRTLAGVQSQKDEVFANTWYLLQARALDAAGKTQEAIKLLSENYASQPTITVLDALMTYGAKIGLSKRQITEKVWALVKAKAKPAPQFTLKRFGDNKPVSLSDYRGRVVIIDFWFPNCGPCRIAFPHLQKVAAKFKDMGVAVLAINGIEDQEDLALPYLRSKHYGFLALKGNQKFASDVYGVITYPTTFLVGADGNIYFHPSFSSDADALSAEAAIELLLAHAKS